MISPRLGSLVISRVARGVLATPATRATGPRRLTRSVM
jgi:hypothetical protein